MSTAFSSHDDTRRAVLGDLAAALPAGLFLGWLLARLLELSAGFPLQVLAVYAAVGLVILLARPDRLPGGGLGAANRVTLVRVVLTVPLAALLFQPIAPGVEARWWIVGLATTALVLDGIDGWVARRTGTGTPFGARFDMETDALLLLILSGLVWRSGQAGAWVLGLGAMRYLFVAAGRVLPALRGELFPSLRRKVVCVVQGIALLVAVGPPIPSWVAAPALVVALALLALSFAVDTLWLLRSGGSAPSVSRAA